jgi:preprotein translocase subunit SecB
MDNQVKSNLRFINYIVNKIEFETNQEFKEVGEAIDIDFDIDDEIAYQDNKLVVTLKLKIFDDMKNKNYPFRIYTEVKGIFETQGDDIHTFTINGIAILYPYLRSIVSTYTANSNVSTLILPPINVVAYLNEKKAKQKQESED